MRTDTVKAGSSVNLAPLLAILVAGVLYLTVLAVGARLLNDPDTYWHLVVGQWIAVHRAVPHADLYSFTMAGEPWIAKEWLSQLLYAGAHAVAGWTGMAVLAAAAMAAAFGLLARELLRRLAPIPAMALVAAAFLLAAPHALARPHLLALPVMVAFVAGLVRAVDERRQPSWWLLALMIVWANLHAGFTFGLLLIGACALDALVTAKPVERVRTLAVWVRFGVLAVVAASVTPYGPESILMTGRILGLGPALSIIGEWQPADFSHLAGFEVALLLGIGLALYAGFRLPPVRILILLGLVHMALSAERNAELLGLLAPLFIAAPLARQFPSAKAEPREPGPRAAPAVVALILVALIPATVAIASSRPAVPAARITPAAAVAALKMAGATRVLNDYDFGGYLVFSGLPTFIDGRTELYGGPFVLRHHRAVTLANLPDFERLLEEYRIDATLLSPATPAVAYLDRLPGWHRVHSDSVAVAHVRERAPTN
jgi:hypothetical protein